MLTNILANDVMDIMNNKSNEYPRLISIILHLFLGRSHCSAFFVEI